MACAMTDAPSPIKFRCLRRLATIPEGCWPRRLHVELAAGYVGEKTVAAFVSRVRKGEYPPPIVNRGRRQLWLRDDLDRAIGHKEAFADAAGDL
jgi:hypothetical protein